MDFRETTRALRLLAREPPTPEQRARVGDALRSKFEGVQSVAAQVLAAWGDRTSVETLRSWLLTVLKRPYGWAIRGVAIRALAKCIDSTDTGWVLDLYFSRPDRLLKHEFLPLAAAVDPTPARPRLTAEVRSSDPLNRHAAIKVICRMPYRDRETLIRPILADTDKYNRKAARSILSSLTSA